MKWVILLTIIYVLYEKGLISWDVVYGLINYAKKKLKNISGKSRKVEIDIGNDYLSKILPFEIHELPPGKKQKIIMPKWGIYLIGNGSILLKKFLPILIASVGKKTIPKSRDPSHPLENPYNDIELIKSILDEIDKLNKD